MKRNSLILGDGLALAIVTIIGFASHRETNPSNAPCMLTTFLSLLAGWFLIAPWLGVFDEHIVSDPKQLWRLALAMLLAAPLTAVLRAALLNSVALPLFTLILGCSAALSMLAWRVVWLLVARRTGPQA